ncbi:PAAR domain-containing protein [Dyella kyungheensis]|uniref:PAAR domain-containing protein n=1 Tax=Dyella kyungheensis TaxID=1242174 RepID=A0ABS2JWE5_9GAMM|nr:PAAR domain-containing protein [Dyella kyungheensis]
MKPVVLVGHRHTCPIHGEGTVTSGAPHALVGGEAVARVGDSVSCGARITSGSPSCEIEGRAVARQGDATDHGGVLSEGDESWMVD